MSTETDIICHPQGPRTCLPFSPHPQEPPPFPPPVSPPWRRSVVPWTPAALVCWTPSVRAVCRWASHSSPPGRLDTSWSRRAWSLWLRTLWRHSRGTDLTTSFNVGNWTACQRHTQHTLLIVFLMRKTETISCDSGDDPGSHDKDSFISSSCYLLRWIHLHRWWCHHQ